MRGLDLIRKRSSIFEIFILVARKRCQRYWTNATANADLRKKPNVFARTEKWDFRFSYQEHRTIASKWVSANLFPMSM